MIRVLHNLSALDGGGDAKLLYDYYSNMDREKVHFDFLIYDFYDCGILEEPLKELGCTIYKIPRIKKGLRKFLKAMKQVIVDGQYDVIHSHLGGRGLFAMYYAKKNGVKKRIVHSHVAYEPVSKLKRCINILLARLAMHYATDLFACGLDAGVYMWGKRATEKGRVHIMTNAVDTKAFTFSEQIREEKRKELGINGKFAVGIVGRLSTQKNYPFLFRVYQKILEKTQDIVLVVVGRGIEETEIKGYAKKIGVFDQIQFLGIRDDVPKLLNAFDLFVLPSLYEGLPVVLIEAQANGLGQIVSEKVTKEIQVTDLVEFLPIDGTEEQWATVIIEAVQKKRQRICYGEKVLQAGYDIAVESKKMEQFYLGEKS